MYVFTCKVMVVYHINGKILAHSHTANFGSAGCALAMTQKQQSVSTGVQKLLLCATVVCNHLKLTEQAKQTCRQVRGLLTPIFGVYFTRVCEWSILFPSEISI